MRKDLTSADITNITWLNSEYGIGNRIHTVYTKENALL